MILKLSILIISFLFTYIGVVNILPEYYWFQSFNLDWVYLNTLLYKLGIFFASFFPVFLFLYLNDILLSSTVKKATIVSDSEPDRYPWISKLKQIIKTLIGPYQSSAEWVTNKIKIGIYIFVSLIIARVISNYWDAIFIYFITPLFSTTDPIFNKDISFYIFQLPVLSGLITALKFLLFITLFFSLWTYLKKGFFPLFFSSNFTRIRAHIFGLLFLFFSVKTIESYLQKFSILFNNNDIIFGANYTDINITLKAFEFMPFLWIASSIISLLFIYRPNIKIISGAVSFFILFQVIGFNVLPSIIQNYVVSPNEFNKETPYIQNNIKYTQMAYQINDISEQQVNYEKSITNFNESSFKSTLNNIRLWNPGPLKSTLKQLQEMRLYYEFKNIDIDRYIINGEPQQVMLSVRELDINQISQQAQTWVNQHLIFTHGYGLTMVPVNKFNSEGLPEFMIRDIPPVSQIDLSIKHPEIYFGEATNHYVVANSKQEEFDYPKDNANIYTHYKSTGGIQLDSLFKRFIYAIKLKDIKLLISNNIHSESRLMYDRNIHVIPKKITPFITYDKDPYMVINNEGRLIWMLDGYTMSSFYPYASPYSRKTNYIRNSVTVTIDAYSGEVKFYIKDSKDPIIKAYATIFPDLFAPLNDMPSDLVSHIRYPKDLFKVQAMIYNTFHMNDPQVFYNKEDVWTFPTETYDSDSGIIMEPYYMYITNPVTKEFEYSIIMPLTPSNKNNLVSILTVSCEPDSFGKLNIYQFPKQETVYGPLQIESRIDQNTEISKDLTLWGQVGSRVIRGNLMVIPYENTILYVEPIYLQATQSKLPELKRVIVALGDQVTMSSSIDEGLSKLSKGSFISSSKTNQQETSNIIKSTGTVLTDKIIQMYSKVKDALSESDWKSFGEYFSSLDALIQELQKEE